MMQAGTVIGVADIHARTTAYGVKTLEDRDRCGVVGIRIGLRRRNGVIRHAGVRLQIVEWIL
jgi:hypothetical protein